MLYVGVTAFFDILLQIFPISATNSWSCDIYEIESHFGAITWESGEIPMGYEYYRISPFLSCQSSTGMQNAENK